MGKTGYKQKYIKQNSSYTTDHCSCNNCIAKMFLNNVEDIIKAGIGATITDTVIVYPTYISVNNKLFDEFTDIIVTEFKNKRSSDILERYYITPCIKCFIPNSSYNINKDVLNKCIIKTISEIANKRYIKNVILLGDSIDLKMYINDNINIYSVYTPYDLFKNDNRKKMFLDELFKII